MPHQDRVFIVGPYSGYPDAEISRMFMYQTELLVASGYSVFNTWESLKSAAENIAGYKTSDKCVLSKQGRCELAQVDYLMQILERCTMIYVIPEVELCMAARLVVALAYKLGLDILENVKGDFKPFEMTPDDVFEIYADDDSGSDYKRPEDEEDDDGDDDDEDDDEDDKPPQKIVKPTPKAEDPKFKQVGLWLERELNKPSQPGGG